MTPVYLQVQDDKGSYHEGLSLAPCSRVGLSGLGLRALDWGYIGIVEKKTEAISLKCCIYIDIYIYVYCSCT